MVVLRELTQQFFVLFAAGRELLQADDIRILLADKSDNGVGCRLGPLLVVEVADIVGENLDVATLIARGAILLADFNLLVE